MTIKIVPVGGRIKSASVGLDIFSRKGEENFQTQMKRARDNPRTELLNSFFPSDSGRLKQMMQGIGFYRPILKTDQGMGGNFLPFYIDSSLSKTDLSQRQIVQEEGLIIPELYLEHDPEILKELRETFQRLDLWNTNRILMPLLTQSREAEKGRIPFFFIRPALTSSPIIFGYDIIDKVTEKVESLLNRVMNLAGKMAGETHHEFLYFIADVFITIHGEVVVERLHFPDVGFFITELSVDNSIATEVQKIVEDIKSNVLDRVQELLSSSTVYIVTRDEVLARQEDVLEIFEIQSISRQLENSGFEIKVIGASQVWEIPNGSTCLILNLIDHGPVLLERFRRGEIKCYPSPYLQLASGQLTGLQESVVPSQLMNKFISLIDCNPKRPEDVETVISKVDSILLRDGIVSELLHIEVDEEIVPVHRKIHHSWKQLVKRVNKHRGDKPLENVTLRIRELPITCKNSMVTSTTGPRLHSFRFTFTN